MAGKYNIVADQGATFSLNFDVATDGVAWNLSTYSAAMQVRKSANDATTLLDLSSPSDIVMTSGGNVTVTVPAATMATLPAGRWVYDFELDSGSVVTRLLEGRFIVSAEVTQ